MNTELFENLIHKYTEKANLHGYKVILGNPKDRKYHEIRERNYDRLVIEIINLYLEEYGKSN